MLIKKTLCCLSKVHVDEWRIGLWHSALINQGIDDAEMAKQLQAMFRTARLEHFILEHGVKASNPLRFIAYQTPAQAIILNVSQHCWSCAVMYTLLRATGIATGILTSALAKQEMVEGLKGRGLKAVIITNGHPEIQRGKLERVQAATLFDAILVGGEEIAAGGREKPAASIFLKACQLAGCQPSEVHSPAYFLGKGDV